MLKENAAYLERFCHPGSLQIGQNLETPEQVVTQTTPHVKVMMPLLGLIKVEDEIKRLENEADKLAQEVQRVEKKLSNHNFVSKAPADIVNQEKEKGASYQKQLQTVRNQIEQLKQL